MKSLILALTLISTPAFAQDFTPYLGVFAGGNTLSTVGSEANKNGFNAGAKILGSWNYDQIITDAGLGWQYNRMKGGNVTVTTRSLFLEGNARFKINNQWSLGPMLSVMFGVDNTQSETEGSQTVTMMGGLQAVYIINRDWRFEAHIQNSMSGTDERSNLVANIGIQFALPWDNTPEVKPVVYKKPMPKKSSFTPLPTPPVNDDEVADVKISLKSARVGFGVDAYQLDDATSQKLATLGKYLGNHQELYGRIKISGHTDVTGPKEHNISLSQDRADSVMNVLVKNGIPESKIQARGYGPNRPVDSRNTPEAYEKNRRTEIEFFEVKDRVKLNRILEEILK